MGIIPVVSTPVTAYFATKAAYTGKALDDERFTLINAPEQG
jgi:hypothetical protein